MTRAFYLGQFFGVRIFLHYTWLVIFVLATAIMVTLLPQPYSLWQKVAIGIFAGPLFLLAIGCREFILNFLSVKRGLKPKYVTVFAFGGLPSVSSETSPHLEKLLSAAGVATNLLIAGIFYATLVALANTADIAVAELTKWFALIFMLLTLLHLIPGYPLDGGRFLRAFLWQATGSYERATRTSSWIGWSIGLLILVGGLALIVTGQWPIGLITAFTGWVLEIATSQVRRELDIFKNLGNITVREVMTKEYPTIDEQMTLSELIRDYILVKGHRYFIVAGDGNWKGILDTRNLRHVPRRRWNHTQVGSIMTPARKLKAAHAQQPVLSVLGQMQELEIEFMPVLEADKVVGILTLADLTSLVKTRMEFGPNLQSS